MNFDRIELAIKSGLFIQAMLEFSTPPEPNEIDAMSSRLGIHVSADHRELLLTYGGSSLDAIRINGLDGIELIDGLISFANDYNGYIFHYDPTGKVFVIDTDGGECTYLAGSLDEFFNDIFLGAAGEHFYGVEWVKELSSVGLA
jgi:hypothetical protein